MARISITEASKRFGVATNTIRARVRSGELTTHSQVHGKKTRAYFDVVDLVRVFGEPSAEPKAESQIETNVQDSGVVDSLNKRIVQLELENVRLNAQRDTLNVEIVGLRKEVGLLERHLEDFRKVLAPQLEAPKTFMERVFGKKKAP